ncbi:MAG: triose-phosphate isomerase [Chloroflexi bacterium]|nr:triose-phosphate isomerase [Chloroflexota bacterium]
MRKPVIAGNWKMNTTVDEAVELARRVRDGLKGMVVAERIVCPPFVSLAAVAKEVGGSGIRVGAQNVSQHASGAYTGEVSVAMIRATCSHVIVGHSERRQFYCETDEMVAAKATAAIGGGLHPIVCIGESRDIREAGNAVPHVVGQLKSSLKDVSPPESLIVAYEPVWAIGTGMAATPEVAQEMCAAVRGALAEIYTRAAADRTPILYGGSVNAGNVASFIGQPDVDGALVGGASLKPDDFIRIAETIVQTKSK